MEYLDHIFQSVYLYSLYYYAHDPLTESINTRLHFCVEWFFYGPILYEKKGIFICVVAQKMALNGVLKRTGKGYTTLPPLYFWLKSCERRHVLALFQ